MGYHWRPPVLPPSAPVLPFGPPDCYGFPSLITGTTTFVLSATLSSIAIPTAYS